MRWMKKTASDKSADESSIYVDPFATAKRYPTAMKYRLDDGRLMGVDGSVWMAKRVPLSALADAKTLDKQLESASPLSRAFEEISRITSISVGNRRSMVRNNYREFHMLLLDIPRWFTPPRQHLLRHELAQDFSSRIVSERLLLFMVRLRDSLSDTGGIKGAIDSVSRTLLEGGVSLENYASDTKKVGGALARAGLVEASADDIRLANSWFNHGGLPDPIVCPDLDCMAVFNQSKAARYAMDHLSGIPVSEYPDMEGYHALSFATAQEIDPHYAPATSHASRWAESLLDAGAMAISIRGSIEPSKITGREIAAQRRRYLEDIRERHNKGQMTKGDQQAAIDEMASIGAQYERGEAPSTIVDASVIVAFAGVVPDVADKVAHLPSVHLNPMTNRQPAALAETWPTSGVRSSPHRLDLPVTTVAHSGVTNLSRVGDAPTATSALVGFTESDQQAAWFNPRAAYEQDRAPIYLAAGSSGSGKTMLLLYLADQLARAGTPVIIVDPKMDSDHSEAVRNSGGAIYSLDELISSDGVFDPLRFALERELAVELAATMLQQVNPWGDEKANWEVASNVAIKYGVGQGATCTGQALLMALRDGKADPQMVNPVISLAESNAQFRAICGIEPSGEAMRSAEGITYIRVGRANLSLPEPGSADPTLNQRISLNLVKLMVSGSATALTGRHGVVMLDEAWVFLGSSNSELERLGRVARSQMVSVMLFTQRVSDATIAGIDEHIAGGFILPLKQSEAIAACRILQLEPTAERIRRITATKTIGDASDTSASNSAPNWDSMHALFQRDDVTGKLTNVRGSIAYYADVYDRVVPVEVVLPQAFLDKASTKYEDIERRKQARQDRGEVGAG